MPQTQRERSLLELLGKTGSARIPDLARALAVTEETVRRNVRRLEAAGTVTKVHGGVHLRDWAAEPAFALRYVQNATAKRAIAARVAGLIADGASVFLDVGSTTAYVAQALRGHRDLQVVTNSLSVAVALAGVNGNRLFMAGGELRRHDGGAFGAEALAFVRQFRLSHAVMSAAAVDPAGGFLLQDLPEAEFGRAVLAQAAEVIVAADASKFGRSAPIRLAPASAIHRLVTDAAPPADIAAMLAAAGVRLTLA
jgi:DeoR family glycerol-3-phosphate regulon repressor